MNDASMKTVFPPQLQAQMAAATAAAVTDPQREAQAAAKSREAYFAGLWMDVDFQAHVLNGVLAEREAACLGEITAAKSVKRLVEARARWVEAKLLREDLRDQMKGAHEAVLAEKAEKARTSAPERA